VTSFTLEANRQGIETSGHGRSRTYVSENVTFDANEPADHKELLFRPSDGGRLAALRECRGGRGTGIRVRGSLSSIIDPVRNRQQQACLCQTSRLALAGEDGGVYWAEWIARSSKRLSRHVASGSGFDSHGLLPLSSPVFEPPVHTEASLLACERRQSRTCM